MWRFVALAFVCLLAAPSLGRAALLEAYTGLPVLDKPTISPAGDRLAYILIDGDKRGLAVKALGGKNLAGVNLGDQKVRNIEWADNDHVLITIERFGHALDQVSNFLTLTILNVTTNKFVTFGAVIFSTSSVTLVDGKPTAFVESPGGSYGTTAYRVNLETGRGTYAPEAEGVMDASGKSVFEAQYWEDTGRWRLTRPDGIGRAEIWSGKGFRIETPELLGVGRTDQTALISVPEDTGPQIYEVTKAGVATKLKFGTDAGAVEPIYRPLTGALMGFAFEADDDEQYVFLDSAADTTWMQVVAGFPGRHVVLVSRTPDFGKLVVHTEGEADSGSYYLVDNKTHQAALLGRGYPAVEAADIAPVQFIHYKAADGLVIPAYLTLPRGRDARNLPLIVLPHGGPEGRDEPGFDYFSQVIASRGYAVLQPEFRGSSGFGENHLKAGFGEWGRKMQTDLSDGVRYLTAQGTIDPKRVCIFGWSYGGYAALAGATLDKGIYRCAVAGAPVADLPDMLTEEREATGGWHDSPVLRYEDRYMGVKGIGDGKLVELSPARHADAVNIPLLLIHGKQDTTVPYHQSELMAEAMKRAGKPVEFVTLVGEDHHLSKAKTRQEAMSAVVAFLEKNNPPN